MSERAERAVELFDSGFNCAQSVLAAFCGAYGVEEAVALKMSSGLGGGVRAGEICGAVSGAAMVIGLKHGQNVAADKETKTNCNQKVVAFISAFRAQNGSVVCREILGFDVSVKEEYERANQQNLFKTKCVEMIKSAVALLEALGY